MAIAGAASGAWFGLFVGLLLFMFSGQGGFVLTAVGIGAGFGLLFSVLSYALTQGKRDFTSQSQIVASSYGILCAPERAGEARQLLGRMPEGAGGVRGPAAPANPGWGTPSTPGTTPPAAPSPEPSAGAPAPAPPAAPPTRTPDPRWTTPTGEPRYGAMRPTSDQPTDALAPMPHPGRRPPRRAPRPARAPGLTHRSRGDRDVSRRRRRGRPSDVVVRRPALGGSAASASATSLRSRQPSRASGRASP